MASSGRETSTLGRARTSGDGCDCEVAMCGVPLGVLLEEALELGPATSALARRRAVVGDGFDGGGAGCDRVADRAIGDGAAGADDHCYRPRPRRAVAAVLDAQRHAGVGELGRGGQRDAEGARVAVRDPGDLGDRTAGTDDHAHLVDAAQARDTGRSLVRGNGASGVEHADFHRSERCPGIVRLT